jgi:transposase
MFIKVTQSGNRRYAQLVESFRNEDGKPRQRTVCTLGRLEPGGEVDTLIASLQRARGLSPGTAAAPAFPHGLRFTESRHAGDIWALSELWRALGFDDLATSWRRSKSQVDVLSCLRLMVFNRLSDPGSKLGVLRWLETAALPAGLGSVSEHQHLLRAMDVLDEYSEQLGSRLATLMRPLIDQDLSVVFYDLTTIAVTGQSELSDDVRAYGMAKSGLIERQFMLSLVQTAEGLPIAHEVHPGNTAEAKTLLPMIRALLARYPLKRVVLIADRGLLSIANIEELGQLQSQLKKDGQDVAVEYILAVPAARYGDFADDLKKLHEEQGNAHGNLQEWCAETTWQGSRLVVAHDPVSASRRAAARNKTMAELLDLGQQCSVKLDEQDKIRLAGKKRKGKGRPMSDSGTKARFYHAVKDAHMAHVIKVDLKAELFSYSIDEDKKRYLELLDGKLLLVTNTDGAAAEVLQRYKSLADIERGFRVLKSDIEIGPVYHRLPQRIRAHALICFLALVLYRVMRMRLKAARRSESPATLLEQLKRIHQQTVQTSEGQTMTGLTEMTPAQKSLFAALELTPPTPSDLAQPAL